MTWIIGLTGGIGSGKSAAADHFGALGASIVDTDGISRQLTGPQGAAIPFIREAFGPGVIEGKGALDRAAMRKLVFSDASARQRLEAILHPMIKQESLRQCRLASGLYVVLVVPLLFESGSYLNLLQRTLVVDCSEDLQITRVMTRSGLSAEEVRRIMDTQIRRSARLLKADDVISNETDLKALYAQVADLHGRYLSMATAFARDSVSDERR